MRRRYPFLPELNHPPYTNNRPVVLGPRYLIGDVALFVVAGCCGWASLGESGELVVVEGRGSASQVEVRWLVGEGVGEVEPGEALEALGEASRGGADGVGELVVVDGDGSAVVGWQPRIGQDE